jgi:hypothetical protein
MKLKDGVYTSVTVIKNGVEVTITFSNHIRAAMHICDEVSKKLTEKGIVVTSVLDGKHKDGSKHYIGEAFDIRSFIYSKEQIELLTTEFKKELGKDYDVVYEIDHFHIEYDQK